MRLAPVTATTLRLAAAAGRRLVDTLAPPGCAFCGVRLTRDEHVCDGCWCDLPRRVGGHDRLPPLSGVTAPFEYAFPIDAAIKAFKFRRKLYYAPAFSRLIASSLPGDVDALLPTPLHWLRHATRGFNQADELARLLRQQTGLPLVSNVRRTRRTAFQSGLSASQRRRNLASAFAVRGTIRHSHILIVDDVITTGETCRQLALALLDAGADRVSALAIARAAQD